MKRVSKEELARLEEAGAPVKRAVRAPKPTPTPAPLQMLPVVSPNGLAAVVEAATRATNAAMEAARAAQTAATAASKAAETAAGIAMQVEAASRRPKTLTVERDARGQIKGLHITPSQRAH